MQAPTIKLGAKNQNELEKTFNQSSGPKILFSAFSALNHLHISHSSSRTAHLGKKGKEPPLWCKRDAGQRVSMAQHSTCLDVVLVTEEGVQHALCVALKRSTPIMVSSSDSAHFADVLKAGALLHPAVNLDDVLEHERASPLSNVPLGRAPGTWSRGRPSAYRDRVPGVCALISALESGMRVIWSGSWGGPDAVVFSPVSPVQARLHTW